MVFPHGLALNARFTNSPATSRSRDRFAHRRVSEGRMTADTEDAAAEAVDTDERTLALIPSVVRAYQTVLSDPGRFSRFALGPLAGLVIGNVMVMLEQAAADPPSDTWRNGVFLLQLAFVSIFSLFWQQQVLTGSATGSLDRLGLSFRELRFFGYCVLM